MASIARDSPVPSSTSTSTPQNPLPGDALPPQEDRRQIDRRHSQSNGMERRHSQSNGMERRHSQSNGMERRQSLSCDHYHAKGLASPKDAIYAMKVCRKATERILSKSPFFSEGGFSCVIQNESERIKSLGEIDANPHKNKVLKLDARNIQLGKVLGKGGFCAVYEAHIPLRLIYSKEYLREEKKGKSADGFDNEREYCVKFLKANALPDRKKFARGVADLSIEAHFLASLNHPHILALRAVSESFTLFDPTSPEFMSSLTHLPGLEGGCFLLLDRLELTLDKKIYCEWKETASKWNSLLNKTLHDIKGSKRKSFRLERVNVALHLAQALQYLHQHNICYRDLKPDNIGFDTHGSLKLFDFGLAKELKEHKRHSDGTYQLTANTGSKRYMAPEVASRQRYNLSVDVFSYGILFWEICSLEKPFDGFTEMQHMNLVVQRGHRPKMDSIKSWPVSVRHIISRCWHPISNERPTFRQVVNAMVQVQVEMAEG